MSFFRLESGVDQNTQGACPRLWNSAFVDYDGSVYACCHYQPGTFGNLLHEPLESIREGAAATRMREQALRTGTPCFSACSILTADERSAPTPSDPRVPGPIERLHLLFGEGCGLDCVMCHQDHRNPSMLSADMVMAQTSPLPDTVIEVQGGEPLQLKESRAYLRAIIAQGHRPTVITNGLFLSGELARTLVTGCSRIKVSLNAASAAVHDNVNRGSSWTKVIGNLKEAVRLRDDVDRSARLIGHMTLVAQNYREAAAFVALCAELELDGIEFGFDAQTLPYALAQDREIDLLRKQMRTVVAKHGERLRLRPDRLLRLGLL